MQCNKIHQLITELQPTHFLFLSSTGVRSIADPPSGTRPVAEPSISVARPECVASANQNVFLDNGGARRLVSGIRIAH